MFRNNNLLTIIFLIIIAGLIGWNIYIQYKLDEEKKNYFNEKMQLVDLKYAEYKKQVIASMDSLIQIRKVYKTIEVERNEKNEAISKINNADSIANEFNDFWTSKSRK